MLRNISISEFKIGFDDRFNVETTDWHNRINKWVLKACALINQEVLYNPVCAKYVFTNNILHLPIDIKILKGIVYNGVRLLPIDYATSNIGVDTDEFNTYYLLSGKPNEDSTLLVDPVSRPIEMGLPSKTVGNIGNVLAPGANYTYTVMRNDMVVLNVPDKDGEVLVYYKSLPYKFNLNGSVDFMIPDDEFFIDALEWYVLLRLSGRGYKHAIFTYPDCEVRWDKAKRIARRAVSTFTEDQRERASNIFRGFLSDYDKWYNLK